jgi:hypothetical protein
MRNFYQLPLRLVASYRVPRSLSVLLLLFFLIPLTAFSQTVKEIELIVECVEYIGSDMYLAHFGYKNPNKDPITVPEENSTVVYNYGQSKKNAPNNFKSGRQYKVFSQEFHKNDKCTWYFTTPSGIDKEKSSSINSVHCSDPNKIRPLFRGVRSEEIIGQELTYLAETYDSSNPPEDLIYQITGDEVLIDIIAKPDSKDEVLNVLATYNVYEEDILDISENKLIYTLLWSINLLEELNNYPDVFEYVRNSLRPFGNNQETQGDVVQKSHNARLEYGVTGAGVKVGIFSDSFDALGGAQANIDADEIPDVYIFEDNPTGNDEGRAMAQHIRDVAPGAQIGFKQAFFTESHFAKGIVEVYKAGYDVLVSDVTYPQTPWYREGLITQAVKYVTSEERQNDPIPGRPALYVDAAGNFSSLGYELQFTQGPQKKHLWDGIGDTDQRITVSGYTYIVLQWEDDWYSDEISEFGTPSGAQFDFDVILGDVEGNPLYVFGRKNSDPYELVAFEALEPTEIKLS